MLYNIVIILLILRLLGYVGLGIAGGLIHVLLVIAVICAILDLTRRMR